MDTHPLIFFLELRDSNIPTHVTIDLTTKYLYLKGQKPKVTILYYITFMK